MHKILILGSKGMLGQMVYNYFGSLNYDLIAFDERIDESNIFRIIEEINSKEAGIVINCIGKIKQKSDNSYDLLWANTIFPMELGRSLKKEHFLVQPSTDCVFSGKENDQFYEKDAFNDAEDVYGWSKSLGEFALQHRVNALIVRVSIIGPDKYSNKGLLSWFLNTKDTSVNGFSNHYWNGITTLAWCKFLENFLVSDRLAFPLNTVQLGTKTKYSKYDMLVMFKRIFGSSVRIKKHAEGSEIYKCLAPDIAIPELEEQLIELHNFIKNA